MRFPYEPVEVHLCAEIDERHDRSVGAYVRVERLNCFSLHNIVAEPADNS